MAASWAIRVARPPSLSDFHTLRPGCKEDLCLVDEKLDKEFPGIVGARELVSRGKGTTILRDARVVIFVLPFSHLQGVEC